jgi:thioredoxin-like negative regulator of GroEL
VYPTPEVTAFIRENFVTARVHIKENPTMWHRYGIRWTPTVLVLAADGTELRRIEGFLPADELLGQLRVALGYNAANAKNWKDAQRWFEEASANGATTDAAPEALYWAGVSRYSASHDPAELRKLKQQFAQRFQNTAWAKRTVVWAG